MIYERTQQGQFAAYDAGSPLPRKLRSLLKVIDGKTATEVYIKSLESFGDVPKLLESLEMAGLVATVADDSVSDPSGANRAQKSKKPGFLTRLRQVKSDFTTSTASQSHSTELLTVSPHLASQAQGLSTRIDREVQAVTGVQRRTTLARCVDEMSSFVLAHVPDQAFSILSELEQVTDLEQLAIILGGYEQMVASAGSVAQEHVAHIKQIMRENW
jgi:hypothetical protein